MATKTKAPVKKPATKKKAAVKKSPVKKAAVKKSPVKKAAVKKSPVKKAAVKKSPVKKAAAGVSAVAVLEPVIQNDFQPKISFPEAQVERPVVIPSVDSVEKVAPSKDEKKRRGGFLVLAAFVGLIGFAVVSNSGPSTEDKEVVKEEVVEEPAATPSPQVLEAPRDVFADYTPTGAKVTWSAPSNSEQLNGYLVQFSYQGGEFKTIASVETSVLTFELMKIDTPGFTAFRVVAVYADGEKASDISELKGQYQP